MLDWSNRLLTSIENGQPYPNLSTEHPNASTANAYAVQKQFVSQLEQSQHWGNIVGFKAAVTAQQAQQAMGLETGIMGVLFAKGASEANCTLVLDRPVLFETEIGFVVGKTITTPVTADNVAQYISAYMPVIELAAPNLAERPSGIDLIAANSASYGFIRGNQIASGIGADIDTIQIRQWHNDQELYAVQSGDIMAGQVDALTWLINEVLAQGYTISPKQFLITGTIGPMVPAQSGRYRADFAQLGEIAFAVA